MSSKGDKWTGELIENQLRDIPLDLAESDFVRGHADGQRLTLALINRDGKTVRELAATGANVVVLL